MKPKISIFKLIFCIITKPLIFCKNLYFWYKIDKRKKVEYKAWLKTRKSNKQKWDLISTNIQNKLKNKDYIEDQELIKNTYNQFNYMEKFYIVRHPNGCLERVSEKNMNTEFLEKEKIRQDNLRLFDINQELIKNTYNSNPLKETLECSLREILNLNCERTINEDFLKRSIADIETPDFEVDIEGTDNLPMRYEEDYENNLKNLTEF